MDILKRELAPIPLEAWAEIDEQATRSLKAMLSGRKVLDVSAGARGLSGRWQESD